MSLPSKTRGRLTWAARIVVALVFLAAAGAKLSGAAQMVQVFDLIGLGQWFRYFTGVVEVAGAVLLLLPRQGFLGAALLGITMICAIGTHLFVIGGNPVPAIVLAVLTGALAWSLRPAEFVPIRPAVVQ